jgi:hypothetical protein
MEIIKLDDVNRRIISIRNQNVILDSDVAVLYGVSTKAVNQAVKRNLEKFPKGYIFSLLEDEKTEVVTNCDHLEKLRFSPGLPNAFTESGLYMLATILKSPKATETTISIIEAFTKMRQMSNSIVELMNDHANEQKQKNVMQTGEALFGEIIGNALDTVDTETSFELNLAALKIKHTVKRRKK